MEINFKQYPISEAIEHQCFFFKSPQEENGIAGKLTYLHNRGIFINLMNPIQYEDNMTLYVKSENYNYYTLYNVRRRIPVDETIIDEDDNKFLNADYMLSSSEFPPSDLFKTISFDLINLCEWFPRINYELKSYKKKKSAIIKLPPSLTIKTSDNKSITFHNEATEKRKPNGIEFELTSKIIITPSAASSFNDLFSNAEKYRTLFQLLSGGYSAFTEIFLDDENNKRYRVYFIDEKSDSNLKWGAGSTTFLKYSKIVRSLNEIIKNWEKLHTEIKQVIDILIMEYHNYGLSPEVRFLNIARAIETFHRKLRSKKGKDKQLDELVKNVKKNIPQKYKNKFDLSLSYIQEPTLRNRITALYNELKKETQMQLNFQEDWIKKFTKSRNYYTHFGEENKDVLTGISLQELSNRVRRLIYVLVIKELGVKEKILANEVSCLILL